MCSANGKQWVCAVLLCVTLSMSTTVALAYNTLDSENMYFEEPEYLIQLKNDLNQAHLQIENAQSMADAARELGLEEDSAPIQYSKQIIGNACLQKWITQSNIDNLDFFYEFSFDVFTPSYVSVEGFNYLLKETPLSGYGYAFAEMEDMYHVNGLFALAVAQTESSIGKSAYAINRNNYYGMIGSRFANPEEGILAFGKLIRKPLYEGKSIEQIAKIYCPPTHKHWASQNKKFMQGYWNELLAGIEQTVG